MRNKRSPRLVLVGSAVATASLLNACDNSSGNVTHVLRNSYPSQQASLDDWQNPQDCTYIGSPGVAQGTTATSAASSTNTASGYSGAHGTHWYGPYYTRTGVVYHDSGTTSNRAAPPIGRNGTTTELDVRDSELHGGSSAFYRTPSDEGAHESRVISRGGFLRSGTPMRAVGRFFSGFHGSGGG